MKKLLAGAAALALSACTQVRDGVHHVYWDDGGWIPNYVQAIDQANAAGQRIVIHDYCASACTMYLGADSVCIMPGADFEFHGSIPLYGSKADWDALMASYYSPALREWFYANAAQLQGWAKGLPVDEVVRLSGVPYCQ